jgi:hypothetical protein
LLAVAWLGGLGLVLYAIKRNKLQACLLAVFLYVMCIILTGTRVLEGVPAEVGKVEWRDPHHRLTPDARYLLHNHSTVLRVVSEAEYRLFLNYVGCYFSAGFMLFAAALCLQPLDRDGQLCGRRSVIRRLVNPQPSMTCRCPHCSGLVPGDAAGHFPPWCPHCGADFQIG